LSRLAGNLPLQFSPETQFVSDLHNWRCRRHSYAARVRGALSNTYKAVQRETGAIALGIDNLFFLVK
jgi:hypothetical protein